MFAILDNFTGFGQTLHFFCLVDCNITSLVSSLAQGACVNLVAELVCRTKLNVLGQRVQASVSLIPIECETVPGNVLSWWALLAFILLRVDFVHSTVPDDFTAGQKTVFESFRILEHILQGIKWVTLTAFEWISNQNVSDALGINKNIRNAFWYAKDCF